MGIHYSAALLQTRPQGMCYGVPFGYTLFYSIVQIRPQGMSNRRSFVYILKQVLLLRTI